MTDTMITCRHHRIGLVGGLFLALLFGGSSTLAQDEQTVATVEVRFWAFSSNPQFFAYQTTNHHDEEVFFVGQAGSPEPVFTRPVTEGTAARDILVSRELRDAYGWNSGGTEGTTSPSGEFTVEVVEADANLSVIVRQGIYSNPLGQIPRLSDGSGRGNFATWEVKRVMWSDTESHVVVIVHQELAGEWPVQVDTAHGFVAPPRQTPPPGGGAEGAGGGGGGGGGGE